MNVHVNGEARELPDACTVADLLATLGLQRDGIAVAVDREVVPRAQHAEVVLREGATVEVIRAVGGG